MAKANTRAQIGYVQKEVTYGTIPNNAGTPTLAGTDAFLLTSLSMTPTQAINKRPDKTGSLHAVVGTAGKKGGSWSMSCSMAGSGAAGTAPDIDPFLEALMGKAAAVSAGVSVTYAFDDTSPSLSIWDFVTPAAVDQQCAFGAVVNRARFSGGGNFGMAEFSGALRYVLTKASMAAFTDGDPEKGGLTGSSWPAAPAPTTAGTSVAGYKGTCTLDTKTYGTLRSWNVEIVSGRELDNAVFDSDVPGAPADGDYAVNVEVVLTDDDGADLKALKGKAFKNTTVNFVIALGKTAGNIWTFNFNRLLMEPPAFGEDGTFRTVTLRGSCNASAAGQKDEFSLVLT